MKAQIRRLRLKKGDILVVRDLREANALSGLGSRLGIDFEVPIIVAPDGIKRLSREYLEKILEKSKEVK